MSTIDEKKYVRLNYRSPFSVATPCLVCNETIEVDCMSTRPQICDKCKAAILHVRKELENGRA